MKILLIFLCGVTITFCIEKILKSNLVFQIGIILTVACTGIITVHEIVFGDTSYKSNIVAYDDIYDSNNSFHFNHLKIIEPHKPPVIKK